MAPRASQVTFHATVPFPPSIPPQPRPPPLPPPTPSPPPCLDLLPSAVPLPNNCEGEACTCGFILSQYRVDSTNDDEKTYCERIISTRLGHLWPPESTDPMKSRPIHALCPASCAQFGAGACAETQAPVSTGVFFNIRTYAASGEGGSCSGSPVNADADHFYPDFPTAPSTAVCTPIGQGIFISNNYCDMTTRPPLYIGTMYGDDACTQPFREFRNPADGFECVNGNRFLCTGPPSPPANCDVLTDGDLRLPAHTAEQLGLPDTTCASVVPIFVGGYVQATNDVDMSTAAACATWNLTSVASGVPISPPWETPPPLMLGQVCQRTCCLAPPRAVYTGPPVVLTPRPPSPPVGRSWDEQCCANGRRLEQVHAHAIR